jgi:hypothetical protein
MTFGINMKFEGLGLCCNQMTFMFLQTAKIQCPLLRRTTNLKTGQKPANNSRQVRCNASSDNCGMSSVLDLPLRSEIEINDALHCLVFR